MAGIFKAYDIRGIYNETASGMQTEQISPQVAWRFGRIAGDTEVGIWPESGPILIGWDMRDSSPVLAAMMAAGLRAAGREVRIGGLMTTPMQYWYNRKLDTAGSVQITASHNPEGYNGFKVSGRDAVPIGYDSGLHTVESLWQEYHTETPASVQELAEAPDLRPEYLYFIASHWPADQQFSLAYDCGNGMAGYDTPQLLEQFPRITAYGMYTELDGTFPHHEANPLDYSTLVDLRDFLAKEKRYDLGVVFDGDGDRAIFLAGDGSIILPDALTAFLAESLLAEEPGAAIVYDVRMSQAVADSVRKNKGRPIRSKVGHAFMKQVMREENAVFGGEVSCHFYFRDLGFTDSAIYAMVLGIKYLTERNISPLDLNRLYAPYPKSEEINFKVSDPQATIKDIAALYPAEQCDDLDGLNVTEENGWFSLRASNTEPVLRLNAEWTGTGRESALQEYLAAIKEKIKTYS